MQGTQETQKIKQLWNEAHCIRKLQLAIYMGSMWCDKSGKLMAIASDCS